ncbi:hypothetical protein ATL39_3399 [Sinobaca qinghaiensis]|uniref:YwdI family protein n=1 Tax=Sinobaca qinghaiensis TaxID=342944 RepID=A0A419UU55_9BACL|nr:DUF5327 family protein [Sinobaca qinghaiensis]RKD68125.1 hypothetical protein ATL39_3399 [Sinobaca qinghaiensis]
MNISIRALLEKMEEELIMISDHADKEEEAEVKAHARILEAYCGVLLASDTGGAGHASIQNRKPAPEMPKERPVPVQKVKESAGSKPESTVSPEELPSTDGSLFDF